MSRYRIRLELAVNPGFPEGDALCGYEFEAPLNSAGLIDREEWCSNQERYPVKRFWRNEPDKSGRLVSTSEHSWHFRYSDLDYPDEPTFQFYRESFSVGGFVSLRDHSKEMRLFRIVSVDAILVEASTTG